VVVTMGGRWAAHLLAIDLYQAVDDKLAGLPHAARKHGAENGRVESALQRVVGHLHVGRHLRRPRLLVFVGAHASAGSLFGAVMAGKIFVFHGHDGGQIPLELALPLLLPQLLAVVGARARLGRPFLLEVCLGNDVRGPQLRNGIQRPA
jgi:hypothetical protein